MPDVLSAGEGCVVEVVKRKKALYLFIPSLFSAECAILSSEASHVLFFFIKLRSQIKP